LQGLFVEEGFIIGESKFQLDKWFRINFVSNLQHGTEGKDRDRQVESLIITEQDSNYSWQLFLKTQNERHVTAFNMSLTIMPQSETARPQLGLMIPQSPADKRQ
jgi:hypothetical protein